jgi:hypothetical protein
VAYYSALNGKYFSLLPNTNHHCSFKKEKRKFTNVSTSSCLDLAGPPWALEAICVTSFNTVAMFLRVSIDTISGYRENVFSKQSIVQIQGYLTLIHCSNKKMIGKGEG